MSGAARWAIRTALLAAFAAVLAACHTTPFVWSKPGASETTLDHDLQQCAAQAKTQAPTYFDVRTMSAVSNSQETQRLQNSCMIGRGWQLVPQP